MEAKDTMKTYGELKTYCACKGVYEPTELDLREAQAEISFKAGERETAKRIARLLWEYRDRLTIKPEDVIKEIETLVHQIVNDKPN